MLEAPCVGRRTKQPQSESEGAATMKMFGNACWDGRFGSVLVSPLTVFCCEGKPKQVFFGGVGVLSAVPARVSETVPERKRPEEDLNQESANIQYRSKPHILVV